MAVRNLPEFDGSLERLPTWRDTLNAMAFGLNLDVGNANPADAVWPRGGNCTSEWCLHLLAPRKSGSVRHSLMRMEPLRYYNEATLQDFGCFGREIQQRVGTL